MIFLGIKEDEAADEDKVAQVLQQLKITEKVEVQKTDRLGKRRVTEGEEVVHKRPLLVTVKSKLMRNNVLKNAKNLKDVGDSWLKTVFIKADEHPEIRKEMKRLNEVFKLEKAKAENTGLEVKFDRKARKITRNGDVIDSFCVASLFQ